MQMASTMSAALVFPVSDNGFLARRRAQNAEQKRRDLERAAIEKQRILKNAAASNLANAPWLPVTEPKATKSSPNKPTIPENKLVEPPPLHPTTSLKNSWLFGGPTNVQMPTPTSTPIPSPSLPLKGRPVKEYKPLIQVQHKPKDALINRPSSPVKKSSPQGPIPPPPKRVLKSWKGAKSGRTIKMDAPLTFRQITTMNRRRDGKLQSSIAQRDELLRDLDFEVQRLDKIEEEIKEVKGSPFIYDRRLIALKKEKQQILQETAEIRKRLPIALDQIAKFGGDQEEQKAKEKRDREQRIALHMGHCGVDRRTAEEIVYRDQVAKEKNSKFYVGQRDILCDNRKG
jgi:hypothetical protein